MGEAAVWIWGSSATFVEKNVVIALLRAIRKSSKYVADMSRSAKCQLDNALRDYAVVDRVTTSISKRSSC